MSESIEVNQQFLDSSQYLTESILEYEKIYDEDFVSPGGKKLATRLIAQLALKKGSRVLDVGCGLGGSAFVMADEFELQVDGIDLSKNMLEIAAQKLSRKGLAARVNFEWGDILELQGDDSYDAIYSRDVFLHIQDKAALFCRLHALLRDGGKLLFTDYCCGPKPWKRDFSEYVAERSYFLHTPSDYADLIEAAGFRQITAEDISQGFIDILGADLNRIDRLELEPSKIDKLRNSWQKKLERSLAGDQRWGLFSAVK